MMSQINDKIDRCVKCIREKTDFIPKVGLVLGSGLGDFADKVKAEV